MNRLKEFLQKYTPELIAAILIAFLLLVDVKPTTVIAAIVAYVAILQYKTNKDNAARQLKIDQHRWDLEFFEKRYKVYKAVVDYLTTEFREMCSDRGLEYHREVSSARFLFDDMRVVEFSERVAKAGTKVENFKNDFMRLRVSIKPIKYFDYSDITDAESLTEAMNLMNDFYKLRGEAIDIFSEFLTLKF